MSYNHGANLVTANLVTARPHEYDRRMADRFCLRLATCQVCIKRKKVDIYQKVLQKSNKNGGMGLVAYFHGVSLYSYARHLQFFQFQISNSLLPYTITGK